MTKVVLLLIDSLVAHSLDEALTHRTVPALQFLREHACHLGIASTIYPAMTATVDCSLLTGCYPDEHRIPGLVWYDPKSRQIVNYLNDLACVAATGVRRSVLNSVHALNELHLNRSTETIYETLHAHGKSAASINALVHRGPVTHDLRLPASFRWLTGWSVPETVQISGPERLVLGHLTDNPWQTTIPAHLRWPWRAYGINDGYAVQAFANMLKSEGQADFTLIYLPDHDHAMHRKNPAHMRDAMMQLDRQLCGILDAYGDWKRAMTDTVWIIMSDHGQIQIANQAVGQIDLDQMLRPFRVLPLRARANESHEVAVANNERMAYVYPLKASIASKLIDILTNEPRFDVIAWKEGDWTVACQGGSRWKIRFAKLEAKLIGQGYTDVYGEKWLIEGDWRVLDLHMQGDTFTYGDYPDALARLRGALFAQDVPVIAVNARPRYEICTTAYPKHKNGGAHGSLHRSESEVPFWISTACPTFEKPDIPIHLRMTDIKSIITHILSCER